LRRAYSLNILDLSHTLTIQYKAAPNLDSLCLGSQGGTDSMGEGSSSNTKDTINSSKNSTEGKGLTPMETVLTAFKEFQLIGRENEKKQIIKMISNCHSQQFEVISIYGMGGLGKSNFSQTCVPKTRAQWNV
jgi:chromosomal replication initiation ATPase DnaA